MRRLPREPMKSLLLFFVLATTAIAFGNPDEWGQPINGLKVQVLPAKPAFASGEEVKFKFVVANVSDKPIHFFKGGDLWHFVDLFHGGKAIRRADFARDVQIHVTIDDFVPIAPGKTWEGELNYSKNWLPEQFLRTGKMTARYYNPSYDGKPQGIENGWTGTLESNPFDHRIN